MAKHCIGEKVVCENVKAHQKNCFDFHEKKFCFRLQHYFFFLNLRYACLKQSDWLLKHFRPIRILIHTGNSKTPVLVPESTAYHYHEKD